jgi:hypothetical protein
VYAVSERPRQTFFVDGRGVVFPVLALGQNDRVVQHRRERGLQSDAVDARHSGCPAV